MEQEFVISMATGQGPLRGDSEEEPEGSEAGGGREGQAQSMLGALEGGGAECGPNKQGRQRRKASQGPVRSVLPGYPRSCGVYSGRHRKPQEASSRRETGPDTDATEML